MCVCETDVSLIIPEGEGGGGGIVTLEKANLTGDAEITMNRGKRKHIYDFSAIVDWALEMEGDADDLKGSFAIEDISGDREYEIVTKVYTFNLDVLCLVVILSLEYLWVLCL